MRELLCTASRILNWHFGSVLLGGGYIDCSQQINTIFTQIYRSNLWSLYQSDIKGHAVIFKINECSQTLSLVTPHHKLNKKLHLFFGPIQCRVPGAKTTSPRCLYCPVHVCAVDPNSVMSWQEHYDMTSRLEHYGILDHGRNTFFCITGPLYGGFSSQWPVMRIFSLLLAWTSFEQTVALSVRRRHFDGKSLISACISDIKFILGFRF